MFNSIKKNSMKNLVFLTMMFGLMIAFSINVSAQNKGNGKVIKWDTRSNLKESAPKKGDTVTTSIVTSNGKDGMTNGAKYTRLMLTQPGRGIMYFYYAADTPQIQDQLNNKKATVFAVCNSTKPWAEGDKVTIQTQAAQGGGTDVTFTVEGKGCFSFIAK